LALAVDVPWPALAVALGDAVPLLGADSAAPRRYDEVEWTRGGALVVGNEAGGLSDAARAAVTDFIAIPLAPPVDSLNAAIAAAVILFEAARQRRGPVS
jgi:TrmH family RNA methyltransferase